MINLANNKLHCLRTQQLLAGKAKVLNKLNERNILKNLYIFSFVYRDLAM